MDDGSGTAFRMNGSFVGCGMNFGVRVLQTAGVVDQVWSASAVIGCKDWMLSPATTTLKGAKHQQMRCSNISSLHTLTQRLYSPSFQTKKVPEGDSVDLNTLHYLIPQYCRFCKHTGYLKLMIYWPFLLLVVSGPHKTKSLGLN